MSPSSPIKHLDLFSGIGGFALATEMVWDNVEHIFCDNEPFAQAILQKHWPNSTIYGDIRQLSKEQFIADTTSRNGGVPEQSRSQGVEIGQFDLLTGGFPCQPFSQAGRRKGTADDRFLWPEMLRVIREFRPRWVVAENVAGLLSIERGMVFEQVCLDLEREGYTIQAFVIPAVAVNAPHRRDRVWIIANRESKDGGGLSKRTSTAHAKLRESDSDAADTESKQTYATESSRLHAESTRPNWDANWVEVAARLCRMDDGVPRRLDRTPRLKGLGNAIVPQVAAEIFKAIKATDETR